MAGTHRTSFDYFDLVVEVTDEGNVNVHFHEAGDVAPGRKLLSMSWDELREGGDPECLTFHDRWILWRHDWLPYRSAPVIGWGEDGHMILGAWCWNLPWKLQRLLGRAGSLGEEKEDE
jgi:hypothetical protein